MLLLPPTLLCGKLKDKKEAFMKEYWVWLSCAMNGASIKTDELLKFYVTPENIYEHREELCDGKFGITKAEYKSLMNTPLSVAQDIIKKAEFLNVKILTPDSKEFPERFLDIAAVPLALYAKGNLDVLSESVSATIVGTRYPTDYALKVAYKLSYDLASAGAVIVSGFAIGIDSNSHWGAINAGGKTIAVLASGIDVNYPRGNEKLKNTIIQNGVIISEYPFGSIADKKHFYPRNRLMAALSLGTIVVQAPEISGALITARHAIDQGKDVYVVPDSIFNSKAVGSLTLLKDSAFLITKANDFLLNYIHRYPDDIDLEKIVLHSDYDIQKDIISTSMQKEVMRSTKPTKKVFVKLPDEIQGLARKIYDELLKGPATVESIAYNLECDTSEIYSEITILEIEECIAQDNDILYIPEIEIQVEI